MMSTGSVGVFASLGLCDHHGSLTWLAVSAVLGWELTCGSLLNGTSGLSMQFENLSVWWPGSKGKKIEDIRSFKGWQSPRMPFLLPSNKLNLSMRHRMHIQGGKELNEIIYRGFLPKKPLYINHMFIISGINHFFS